MERVVAETVEAYGRLDVVVNNAAGNFPAPLTGLSPNGFKAVVDIDLLGAFSVSRAAYDAWLGAHGGSIVNISATIQYTGMALHGARGVGEGRRGRAHPHERDRVGRTACA
ncbi:SDR family NAD(P)-dependent oxidoreductase [Yinghuangia aomiensis]